MHNVKMSADTTLNMFEVQSYNASCNQFDTVSSNNLYPHMSEPEVFQKVFMTYLMCQCYILSIM